MYSTFSSHKVNIHFLFECINNLLKILIEHISLQSSFDTKDQIQAEKCEQSTSNYTGIPFEFRIFIAWRFKSGRRYWKAKLLF